MRSSLSKVGDGGESGVCSLHLINNKNAQAHTGSSACELLFTLYNYVLFLFLSIAKLPMFREVTGIFHCRLGDASRSIN